MLWKNLKLLGLDSKNNLTKADKKIYLEIGNRFITDQLQVSTAFNEHFTSVASTIVSKLPNCDIPLSEDITELYTNRVCSGLEFHQVSINDVHKVLKSLKNSFDSDPSSISAKFLKDATSILPSITQLLNKCITDCEFPNELKIARVIPIFKKGSKLSCSNYRPISILNCLSKVFERIIFNQIYEYINCNNLLYPFQSGFRPSYSTETALINLIDMIRCNTDKGEYTGLLLLDLEKAFDTVNHTILLSKMEAMGFSSSSINLIRSYLNNRIQFCSVNGIESSTLPLCCGVPQGSVLGPLLFSIYINDLNSVVDHHLFLYADDAVILVNSPNLNNIENSLSYSLYSLNQWFLKNKLSLHPGKSESILFGPPSKLKLSDKLNIKLYDTVITAKTSVNYLGCIIDQRLSFDSHVDSVITRVNSSLRFLYRKSPFLPGINVRKKLCSAIISSHFQYAASAWYPGLSVNLKKKLQIAQNKTVRFILHYSPRDHIGLSEFQNTNWLNIEQRANFFILVMVFKIRNGLAPDYLSKNFKLVAESHNHATRQHSFDFELPRFLKSVGQKTFVYNGINLYNNLPPQLKIITNLNSYKQKVLSFLMTKIDP
ncbi:Uncharacterised protein r2_g1254 [Pycnogonum litorale]